MNYVGSFKALAVKQRSGHKCSICGGQLVIFVCIKPKSNNPPVTYYSCDQCAQIIILEN
jgi:DNA-directed RNA polymerase subunit M/transcription elongation factor TFIIS